MPVLQIRHSSRHLEGLRPARKGKQPPGPGEQQWTPGTHRTAHSPVTAPGKSGTHCGNRAFRGPLSAPPAFCNPGLRDPWQAGLCYHNPMLAETKTRWRIRSRPPEYPMQIRNRLRTCSYPARALPVLLIPPPGGPTACPEGDAVHRPRSAKAAPRSQQNGPGTGPSSGRTWDPLEEHSSQRAADSPGHAPVTPRPAPATWRACGLPGRGEAPQGQENKSGHAGSAGQPRDRSPSSGSLGPIGGILQPQGSRRPRSSSRRCRASDH